jgi:hypothetical protein
VAPLFAPPGTSVGDPISLEFAQPVTPLAMTWNAAAQSLYVLVSFAATEPVLWHVSIPATVYQLDLIDSSGDIVTLWTSAPIPDWIPTPKNFFLSSGSLSEVVLGVSIDGAAEFTIFNEVGLPVKSYGTGNATWKAPVLVNNAGATVAMVTREPFPFGKDVFKATLVPSSWRVPQPRHPALSRLGSPCSPTPARGRERSASSSSTTRMRGPPCSV